MILIGLIIGITLTILGYKFIPRIFTVIKEHRKDNTYEFTFKMTFLVPPNLSTEVKGKLVKSENIIIRVNAHDEETAREYFAEIVHQEIKIDLVELKHIEE